MNNRNIFISAKKTSSGTAKSFFISLFLCILPAFAGFLIIYISRISPPQTVESFYSQNIFLAVSSVCGFISSKTSISLTGIIYTLLGILMLFAAVVFLIVMITGHGRRARLIKRYILGLVLIPSLVLFMFSISCAPNYNRLSFTSQSGLPVEQSPVAELRELCTELIEKTNEQALLLPAEIDSDEMLSQKTLTAFNSISDRYPFVGAASIPAKPFNYSELLSWLNLTGFYFPYTAEANVNAAMPKVELPFTMCHELSHTRGFMLEDEANFMAALSCFGSDDKFIRYSGLYSALTYSMNALYAHDSDGYFELYEKYGARLKSDSAACSFYWQQFQDTPASNLSDSVNNVYLKANGLSDGVQSYGRIVDLLLAYRRAGNEF